MSIVAGSSFIKSGADNTVVLFDAVDTKQISEFGGGSVDDSNYVKKTGQDLYLIHGVLRRDKDEVSMSEDDDDHLTRAEIYNGFVSRSNNLTIYGTKTFNSNANAAGFAKLSVDDTFVLLGVGGTKPLSEFASAPSDLSNYYIKTQTQSKTETDNKCVRSERSIQQTVTRRLKYVSSFDATCDETQDPITNTYLTQSKVDSKLNNCFTKTQTYSKTETDNMLRFKADTALLDDYVTTNTTQYIDGEKPFNTKINATGFVKTGKDNTSILLASGVVQIHQLIGYGNRVALAASYATKGLFQGGYLFKNYPEEERPKVGDKVIVLVGTNVPNTFNIFCYIDQGVPFIISSRWLPSTTALVLNGTYYKKYKLSKESIII
ncbi:MAG: hypothetical protein EZS28_010170 [Streblomastix strix]|uniref:Uncharacterized protein n=1 Tax=Streblomastix strix TaxID=222440 RepID=A0A5J4WGW0_9EUKA|nr:MAG: hypothetical protein EZS28_010170 [Streblomastix strix]